MPSTWNPAACGVIRPSATRAEAERSYSRATPPADDGEPVRSHSSCSERAAASARTASSPKPTKVCSSQVVQVRMMACSPSLAQCCVATSVCPMVTLLCRICPFRKGARTTAQGSGRPWRRRRVRRRAVGAAWTGMLARHNRRPARGAIPGSTSFGRTSSAQDLAFCASNSASVSAPWFLRSASLASWSAGAALGAGRLADVTVERLLLVLGGRPAFVHATSPGR